MAVGCDIGMLAVVSHPFWSVMITVYVPCDKLDMDLAVDAVLHKYVKGDVPPNAVTLAEPSLPPLQLTFVPVMLKVSKDGCVTITDLLTVQMFASTTVIV